MICLVVLQSCMGFVEGETGSYSETCVTCDGDGTEDVSIKVEEAIDIKEEVSIKVEEAIDIKDEIPEDIFPSLETEHEVRLWVVCECEVVAAHAFRPFIASTRKLKLRLTISSSLLCCGCHIPLEIWIAILKRRDFLEVIAINGTIILKCILK